jgi:signal transduction histidine kinase
LDAYSQEDMDLLSGLANVAVIAIENARLFEQVRAGRERLRRLTQQVVSAQEEERRRLSRELHDEAGQALTALKISLDLIQSDLPVEAGSLRQRLAEAGALTETTMEQIRLLAYGLRPPALDAVGLSYTLEGLCRDFAERTQLSIGYAGAELPVLPEAANMCLYRVLQEALTNVAKHADANQVRVALRCDTETVNLLVEDDGQGFEVQAGTSAGIGLLGMQERIELLGGQLEIESWPGQGTRLTAHIPLQRAYLERRRGGDSRHCR